jgi:long-chain acyl-CoA synthetase
LAYHDDETSALAMLTSTSEALGEVNASDVVQVFEPLVHVSGFIATFTTLMAGGTVTLHEGFDVKRRQDRTPRAPGTQ